MEKFTGFFTLAILLLTASACTPSSAPAATLSPSSTPVIIPSPLSTPISLPSPTNLSGMTLAERFAAWSSAPFPGVASAPFVLAENKGDGTRGLVINQRETTAYIVGEFLGQLHRVDIDPTSPIFGETTLLAEKLFILNDIAVNQAETLAYVTREAGPGLNPVGQNIVTRIDLATGEEKTLTALIGQPSNIALSQDENSAYVVDLHSAEAGQGGLYRLDLETGEIAPIVTGLDRPFAAAVNRTETTAYLVTEPARAGEYPAGNLLLIDIPKKKVSPLATGIVYGATGITLSADEKLAVFTEFGHEIGCDGKVSAINIDPTSARFKIKTELVTGLCGAHDVRLNQAETLAYFVEVGRDRLSVIRINLGELR
jgi:DNA-binding beta-propeller fold protein YncE